MKAPSALAKLSLLLLISAVVKPLWAQETRRVRFAITNPPHFLPIWLARDTGIFSKHGLDVEIIFMRGGALITMGILSGELQLSGVGAESVVAAKLEGGDAVLLACPLDTDLVYLIGRPDIKTPEQLKGKSTAVTRLGSSIHFYLRSALKYLGMDADKEMTILQPGGRPGDCGSVGNGKNRRGDSHDPLCSAVLGARLAGADRSVQNRSQIPSLLCWQQSSLRAQKPEHGRALS